MTVEIPNAATVIANTAFKPAMYASMTRGTCVGGNALRICVAPVLSAINGLISGIEVASVEIN
jgi:hypothetical protein